MSNTAPGSPKSLSVTVVGLITPLLGVAYGIFGASVLSSGVAIANRPDEEGCRTFLVLWGATGVVLGVIFLLHGVAIVFGGLGVLRRKQWGRDLTLFMAAITIPWGLALVGTYDRGTSHVACGAAQLVYSGLALVILVRNRTEFSGR